MDILRLLLGLLPASTLKNRLLTWSTREWNVASTATVRPCLIWRVSELSIDDGAFVGLGNIIRDMRRVSICVGAEIGRLNEFAGSAKWVHQCDPDLAGTLTVGYKAAITSRHFMECAGGVSIGQLSVFAGWKSMIITHGIDVHNVRLQAKAVRIGEYCVICAGVIIIPGVTIGDRCIVAAGAVVAKDLLTPETIYAGNPAKPVGSVAGAPLFVRSEQRDVPRDVATALTKSSR